MPPLGARGRTLLEEEEDEAVEEDEEVFALCGWESSSLYSSGSLLCRFVLVGLVQ